MFTAMLVCVFGCAVDARERTWWGKSKIVALAKTLTCLFPLPAARGGMLVMYCTVGTLGPFALQAIGRGAGAGAAVISLTVIIAVYRCELRAKT